MDDFIVWLILHKFEMIGIIWMIVLGPAVGNYACSVVYRLPLGRTPFERHPYCGHCNADLKPIDLAPIISWLRTRGRCRYCIGIIPAIYVLIELACAAVFITYFLHFGISEQFLIYTTYAVFVVILAAIQWQQGWIASTIYSYAFVCILLVRTLTEQSIYPTIQGAFLMLMLMLAFTLLSRKNRGQSPFEKPWVWWFTLMGALVPMSMWQVIVPIFLLKMLVPRDCRVIVYGAAALTLPLFIA